MLEDNMQKASVILQSQKPYLMSAVQGKNLNIMTSKKKIKS